MRAKTLKEVIQSYRDFNISQIKRGIAAVIASSERLRPGFSLSWLQASPPDGAEVAEEYTVHGATVRLMNVPNETESFYHIMPREYAFPEEQVKLVCLAIEEMLKKTPDDIDLQSAHQARAYVRDAGRRALYRLAKREGVSLGEDRAEEMKNLDMLEAILARYTVGYGITEYLLTDNYIQDIYVDAPSSKNMVYVTMGGLVNPQLYGKSITNVLLTGEDTDAMLSRFRFESGRPFSEAMPVLETDLLDYKTRVTVIGKPLSPDGLAIAMRRHSVDPWTLSKFIANSTISPLAAGLISFLIDGRCTILVAGSRGAGKSSLLGALMLEFPKSQRILTIEDTLELPVPQMKALGYKIQSMFVQSTLGGQGEMTADDALRTSLRLGESAIVMGEVRGKEARTLYEAMRAGTAGSSVLGTFHADSAKSVYERVVHDMGIPPKSFLATDIVIVSGLTRPRGTQRYKRRVVQIAEVIAEDNFQDLLVYDDASDSLVPTQAFTGGSIKIEAVANSWGADYEQALQNIRSRAAYREQLVSLAASQSNPHMLSAEWVIRSNNAFWNFVERYGEDIQAIEREMKAWVEGSARYG
jgi:type IV secretory pathway ATPase VirB11/archaellum biosynthesis ATPase